MFKLILRKTEHGVDTNRMHIRNVQEMQILINVLITVCGSCLYFVAFNFIYFGKEFFKLF